MIDADAYWEFVQVAPNNSAQPAGSIAIASTPGPGTSTVLSGVSLSLCVLMFVLMCLYLGVDACWRVHIWVYL